MASLRASSRFTRIFPAILALALPAGLASADDAAPPAPIVIMTETPTDPARFEWLSEGARTALADVVAKHKSGELFASVFVGASGGDYWAYRFADNDKALFGIEDLARQALQACEFVRRAPCVIVSINGMDARDAAGGLPSQPSLLAGQPAEFDAARVPFVAMNDRSLLAAYPAEPKAKVLVLTITAGWL